VLRLSQRWLLIKSMWKEAGVTYYYVHFQHGSSVCRDSNRDRHNTKQILANVSNKEDL
jgi:hypothetical protein